MKTSTWIIILLAVLLVVGILYFDDEDFAQDVSQVSNTVEQNVGEAVDNADEIADEAMDDLADAAEAVGEELQDGADAVAEGIEAIEEELEEGDPVEETDEPMADEPMGDEENMDDDMQDTMEDDMDDEETDSIEVSNNYVEEFDATALASDLENGESVALFFHATRCPTCVALDNDIKENMSDLENVKVYKVDYDTATELKAEYNVTGQHTLVYLNPDGTVKKTLRGTVNSAAQLDEESL